jgi:hypothetical protein
MLKYTKTILSKVSFDKELFKKELKKSIQWLKRDEIIALQAWCVLNFGAIYHDVISEVFKAYL